MSDLSKRVETDVSVFRLRLAPVADGSVVFGWDYPGSTQLRVRILRAAVVAAAGATEAELAAARPRPADAAAAPRGPEPAARSPWQLVYDADTGSFRDRGVEPGRAYRYAVFARNGTGPWVLWRDEVVAVPVVSTP